MYLAMSDGVGAAQFACVLAWEHHNIQRRRAAVFGRRLSLATLEHRVAHMVLHSELATASAKPLTQELPAATAVRNLAYCTRRWVLFAT